MAALVQLPGQNQMAMWVPLWFPTARRTEVKVAFPGSVQLYICLIRNSYKIPFRISPVNLLYDVVFQFELFIYHLLVLKVGLG